MRRRLVMLIMVAVLPALAGCSAVAPWQRGDLAKPQMALDPHSGRTALVGHIHSAREAASGAVTKDGGGCGCE